MLSLKKIKKNLVRARDFLLFPIYFIKYGPIKIIPTALNKRLPDRCNIYSLPEALVAPYLKIFENISSKDLNAVFIGCYDNFNYCPSKLMLGLGESSSRIANLIACNSCARSLRKTVPKNKIYEISTLISEAKKKLPTSGALQDLSISEVENLANYDTMIAFKKDVSDFNFEATEFKRKIVCDCLAYINLYRSILSSGVKMGNVYFFDHYSAISSARSYLSKNQIPNFSVYRSLFDNAKTDLIKITKKINFQESLLDYESFNLISPLPLKGWIVNKLIDELMQRQNSEGPHIYSIKKTGALRIDIPENKKVILAFNSSNDEYRAFEEHYFALNVIPRRKTEDAFSDQFEWLEFLVDKVELSDEYYLIIRLHPRLFANHRDGKVADDYIRYKNLLNGKFKNVLIIWPENNISAYDLFELADVASVSWTSISDELAKMGIKSVCGISKFYFNYDNVNIFKEKTKEAFWNRLVQCAEVPTTLDEFKFAFRASFFRLIGQFYQAEKSINVTTDDLDEIDTLKNYYKNFTGSQIEEDQAINNGINELLKFLSNDQLPMPSKNIHKKLRHLVNYSIKV